MENLAHVLIESTNTLIPASGDALVHTYIPKNGIEQMLQCIVHSISVHGLFNSHSILFVLYNIRPAMEQSRIVFFSMHV